MTRFLALLALVLAPPALQAQVSTQPFVPESGFYWNPTEPGRGYAIEIQDRTLFMTAYVYTEEPQVSRRIPLWYSSAGQVVPGRQAGATVYRFTGELQYSSRGQCLDCPFVEPLTEPTGRAVDITFESPVRATMVIAGEEIELERFWYSPRFSIRDPIFALFGQWMIVTDFTEVDDGILPFDGDLLEIAFEGAAGGQATADGFRGGTSIPVSGTYSATDDFYVIVVAERQGEYLAYYFPGADFGTDRFYGLAERYTPGTDLTGLGFPMQGYRISDRTHAEAVLGAKRETPPARGELPRRPRRPTLAPKALGADASPVAAERLNAVVRELEDRLAQATRGAGDPRAGAAAGGP